MNMRTLLAALVLTAVAGCGGVDSDAICEPGTSEPCNDGGPAVALYEPFGWRVVNHRFADWTTPEGRRLPFFWVYIAPDGAPPAVP